MNKQMTSELAQVDETSVVLIGKDGQEINITSVELTTLINQFRKEEGNDTEKQHKELLRDIRKEIEVLETAGIGQRNFALTSYVDNWKREKPCYQLNKAGVLQMLNKESAVVRYKTVQYIEKLEKENGNAFSGLSTEMQALLMLDKRSQEQDKRLANLEDNIHISRSQQKQLKQFASQVLVSAMGSKYSNAYKKFSGKIFSAFWHDYYNYFNVSSYLDTPKLRFQEALQFINDWKPNEEIKFLIVGANTQMSLED